MRLMPARGFRQLRESWALRPFKGRPSEPRSTSMTTLKFSVQQHIHSVNEIMPLDKAPEAYAKMLNNDARFRMVLKIGR